jgi:hypothetical protein
MLTALSPKDVEFSAEMDWRNYRAGGRDDGARQRGRGTTARLLGERVHQPIAGGRNEFYKWRYSVPENSRFPDADEGNAKNGDERSLG